MPAPQSSQMLRIKLVRSPIGYTERQKATVRALGLRRLQQTVERPDNEAIRGMIFKIQHLLQVEPVAAGSAPAPATARSQRAETPATVDEPVMAEAEAPTTAGEHEPSGEEASARPAARQRRKRTTDETA